MVGCRLPAGNHYGSRTDKYKQQSPGKAWCSKTVSWQHFANVAYFKISSHYRSDSVGWATGKASILQKLLHQQFPKAYKFWETRWGLLKLASFSTVTCYSRVTDEKLASLTKINRKLWIWIIERCVITVCAHQGKTAVSWEASGDSTTSKPSWYQVLLRQSVAQSTQR